MQRPASEGWFTEGYEGEPGVEAYPALPQRTGPVRIWFRDDTAPVTFDNPVEVRFAELGCDLALVLTRPATSGGFVTSMIPMATVAEVWFHHEQPEPFPTAL